ATLDPLSYVDRRRKCRDQARSLAADGQLAPLLDALHSSSRFGREVALAMAVAGREDAYLVAAMRADEHDLAKWAVRAAVKGAASDDALLSVVEDAPQALRKVLYQAVRRAQRTSAADRLVQAVADAHGPVEVAFLLPACSSEVIAEWLPQLPHSNALLRAVARRTPDIALDVADRELAGLSDSLRRVWWSRHTQAIATAARTHALRVIDLLERFTEPGSELPWSLAGSLSALVAADARRTVDLLIRSGADNADLSPGLAHRLVTADPPNLAQLGRLVRDDDAELPLLLRATPPHRREAFFDAVHSDVDMTNWSISRDILELLPAARRIAEARRMAARAERAGETATRQTLLAHLPYDEVRAEFLAQTRRPDANTRAEGYRALIDCAARTRDPARFAAALRDDLARLRKEQDPVRLAAIHAIAEAPPWLFTGEALDALTTLTNDAYAAPDLSSATRSWLHALAARILSAHVGNGEPALVEWALATICDPRTLDNLWLPRRSLNGCETRVVEALWPALRAAADRRNYRPVLSLARQLVRAAWDIDALQEVLGEAVRHGDSYTVQLAAELWLADPRRRDARVAAVLAADPSTITFDCVQNAVAWRRTDLLDPFLTGATPPGRFTPQDPDDGDDEDSDDDLDHDPDHDLDDEEDDSGPEDWVPWIAAASSRWVPRQREAYARLLGELVAHDEFPSDERADWLRSLALVPEAGRPAVLRHVDSDDPLVRAAALGSLARVEQHSASLSLLLARANTDDAHAAVYAASRVARYVPPSRLGPELDALAVARNVKVTARKEAVRLLVARAVPDGVERVADAVIGDDVHPDVLRAALGAVLSRLDQPRAWQLAVQAATASRDVAAGCCRRIP
ncbi:MAG TPA: hypothetical protein VLH10_20660, partial [Yinghuangia sp.]|nr:hypothetical protein [Yinghuangia sp.]